jgi:hypothetical protein
MPTDKDYAWIAAAAYNTGRNTENRVKTASGWDPINDLKGTETTPPDLLRSRTGIRLAARL